MWCELFKISKINHLFTLLFCNWWCFVCINANLLLFCWFLFNFCVFCFICPFAYNYFPLHSFAIACILMIFCLNFFFFSFAHLYSIYIPSPFFCKCRCQKKNCWFFSAFKYLFSFVHLQSTTFHPLLLQLQIGMLIIKHVTIA